FSVNWVVPERALPRGLGSLALWDCGDPELSPVLIQVSPARKAASPTPVDHERVVCAAIAVPASARELGEDHLRALASRVSAQLERLLPFTRGAALLESAPYLDASGVRGSRLLPHPLVAMEDESLLGVGGLHPRAPVKHLFLASREVLPGLGLEGEVLAAQRVAGLVQETLKKHDPLKRR
ncbi:MAG: desaturase, partial [Myxococcaceae bacterium]|nr:desaturase [Myxococcaceae bacterium]